LVSSPSTVLAALCMAKEELALVKELDVHALSDAVKDGKVWAYYAAEGVDGWVSESSVKEVEEVVESVVGREEREKRVKRCKEGMPHAFVLDEGAFFCFSSFPSLPFIDLRSPSRSPLRLPRPSLCDLDRRGSQHRLSPFSLNYFLLSCSAAPSGFVVDCRIGSAPSLFSVHSV
jgi:hypothetical protein